MTEVIMPKMGDGMEEGTLLEWLKKDGDAVKATRLSPVKSSEISKPIRPPSSWKLPDREF